MYAAVAAKVLASKVENKISGAGAAASLCNDNWHRFGLLAAKKRFVALNGAPEIEERKLHGRLLGGLPHCSSAFQNIFDDLDCHECEPTRCGCLLQQEF